MAFSILFPLVILGGCWAILNPPPISMITTFLGGHLFFWAFSPRKFRFSGAVLGLATGVFIHAHSHLSEGRVDTQASLVAHLFQDAALGALIAAVALFPLRKAST